MNGDAVSFNDGDFIKVEYSAWRASDGTMVYTTQKNKAEENDIYNKERAYGPSLVIIGKNTVIKGLEKAIRGMNVNETKKVDVEPAEAFGERNPELVRVMHASDFRKRDIDPVPGLQIDLDGTAAVITAVNSGRVTVDANHPLAGEKITYELKIVAKVDDEKERIAAIVEMAGAKADSIAVNGSIAEISFGDKVDKDANYFMNKTAAVNAILEYLPKVSKVAVKEEYARKEKK